MVEKFKQITGIEERRYAKDDMQASDIGAAAARLAIENSGINAEDIDQLIVAHNFGDVLKQSVQSDAVPSLAARIKQLLGILAATIILAIL
ncbi:MAG: ketoacyl-ACP synthase III, partial [Moraxellaceae bacterium]